ncbi:tRNA (adenosine(37)-N6)-dimethylallyltransferase MiaA [Enterobacteriaceae endosymbiont of Donacia bicoloricornis]|uniref:tRNA (adenosine(37)-N6)-dimethylallyltransferase MiaA n=1 Tax=Enterobacteriaceae endosymbiont of Donacia bicoloricornis TaxID=2675772 RepID=UPI0014498535|nr:tRNA (adenosine(37)-N6)-dimethylallyltransferase MiaA [Enterobacteriaceae endosymbiont of Donacia bicoloricornis]QJC37703.1 tRNA (adenosine(37)-N6)-dimethylallyltransferase MiaA [Enterobacteriaceae endosymbiont of Donacia bicoloricornis]
MNKKNKKLPIVIFLMGTTASKKTFLATRLAKVLPIELISVDSSLIYKKLDIGTDKPKKSDFFYEKHWLIDIKDPSQLYSVMEFYHDVLNIMDKIIKRGKIPLLVGGNMFYFKKLINTISPSLPASDLKIRKMIINQIKNKSYKSYHHMLKSVDVISANNIHHNDIQRNLRALEIFFLTGKPLSKLQKNIGNKIPYKIYQFGLTYYNRQILYENIENRIFKMLELGFEKEVRDLIKNKYLEINFPAIRCIGYKQMFLYILNKISYEEMIKSTTISTRHLAKKQLTWLRYWENIYWFDSNQIYKAYDFIIKFVKEKLN